MRGGKENAAAGVCLSVMGTRMKFPGYPSNREADERAGMPLRARRENARHLHFSPARGKARK